MMERRCAWCGRDLDPSGEAGNTAAAGNGPVSHGICAACRIRVSTGTGTPISEFVGSLDSPVLLLDEDHTVGMINEAAGKLIGGSLDSILGERTGFVFNCENAHLPGGCGRTIHCSGCTIQQAISHTHLTGEPRLHVPATLRVVDEPDLTDANLTISTIPLGDRVLLKIDRYES